MRVVVLGPPSSGKGTLTSVLAEDRGLPHISTGDMLRDEIDRKTDLGRAASPRMTGGQLVSDDLVIKMMMTRLSREDCQEGFFVDGFPRTLRQAEALDAEFPIDVVLYIDVAEDEIIRRATGRRVCKNCRAIFHIAFSPPKTEGKCDFCGSQLSVRRDDTESTVKRRIRVYHEVTAPLIERYSDVLSKIDGNGTPEETLEKARLVLEKQGKNV